MTDDQPTGNGHARRYDRHTPRHQLVPSPVWFFVALWTAIALLAVLAFVLEAGS